MKRYVVQWRGPGFGYVGLDGWFTADIKKAKVWRRHPVVYADEKVIELDDSGSPRVENQGRAG